MFSNNREFKKRLEISDFSISSKSNPQNDMANGVGSCVLRSGLIVSAVILWQTNGAAPTAVIEVISSGVKVRAAPATFGRRLPSAKADALTVHLVVPPNGIEDGCSLEAVDGTDTAILAARSPACFFADRGIAASKAGYKAIVVYNTIEGIYRNRSHADAKTDYECDNGKSWVRDASAGKISGFPDSECAQSKSCASGKCLLTGKGNVDAGSEICCAWDTYIKMGSSTTSDVDASLVFITMADAALLKPALPADCRLYDTAISNRDGLFSWSSFFIWFLGVVTCGYAAWRSADKIRGRQKNLSAPYNSEDESHEPSFDVSTAHAFAFVGVASAALLLLFYVDAYAIVVFAFAISGAASTARVLWGMSLNEISNQRRRVSVEAATACVGISLAVWWLIARRAQAGYAWLLQDLFGICLCIVFLDVVKLPSLKVGAVLLSMAFAYDIFFVFLSPYVFGESVMIKVATGSGPRQDEEYCEKYPSDSDCASTELPMLLLLPQAGGYSMLGLGDIVLPGLLVALAARYDAHANRFDYFPVALAAYALGLGLANLAVTVFDVGQPALLYIVPCVLGAISAKAKHDQIFHILWKLPNHQSVETHASQATYFEPQGENQALLKIAI